MRDTEDYYNISDGWPIEDIVAQWAEDGRKVYDSSMPVWYQPEELWQYRDYVREPPPQLVASMRREGWHERDPAIIICSREGYAYLGEGNHRLAAAIELGIPVPVRFVFWQQAKKPLEMRLADPPLIDLDVVASVPAAELARYKRTGRVPAGTKLEHDAYMSRDRLVLDRASPPPKMKPPARKLTGKEKADVEELLEQLLKKNPRKIEIDYHAPRERQRVAVRGIRPKGTPDWIAVTAPHPDYLTAQGRVPPGGWTVTHVPTGRRLISGVSKQGAILAARLIGRVPCLGDLTDENIAEADFSRDPYRSAHDLCVRVEELLHAKTYSLAGEDVEKIAELLHAELLTSKELAKLPIATLGELVQRDALPADMLHQLPPATQVALDDWLESARPRENPPRKRKVDIWAVEASLRAAGLVQVGGGSRNTYYGLPGQQVGVGYFAKLSPKKLQLVERIRGQYGRKLEDVQIDAMFYGSVRAAAVYDEGGGVSDGLGQIIRQALEGRAGATQERQTFDAHAQELLKDWRRRDRVWEGIELEDLAVGYKAAKGNEYGAKETFDKMLAIAAQGKVDPHDLSTFFAVERLIEQMVR